VSAQSDSVVEASAGVIDGLVRASFTVTAVLSQVAAAHDVSLTQLRVLAILRDREPKMAELAGYLGLDKSSVSGLIDRAEARGLVRRFTNSDDGRVVRVRLTPQGKRLAGLGATEISDLLAPMMGALDPKDRSRLGVLLDKLQYDQPAHSAAGHRAMRPQI
jgi:DNA-binding MarR family transcriptional regulator